MGFFKQRKPRGFQHEWIYVDERKEKLKKIEEKAKRDLGLLPEEPTNAADRIRGAFVESTTHLKRYKSGRSLGFGTLLIALLVMLYILRYLVTGNLTF